MGSALTDDVLVLRYQRRVLIVNLGDEIRLDIVNEPLLAPPLDEYWDLLWSSDSPEYGGPGITPVNTRGTWVVPARAAVLLTARP